VNSPADNSKPVTVETILVLDNEVLVRMPIAQYLRDCGYRVLEAPNVDEARAVLQKPDIHVNVVLSDVEMPGPMNGFGFAKWARSVRPGLKIVLAASPEPAAELCEHGPLLMKPTTTSSS
jgi:CheY-like chemotaxis protein